jgi:anaerobic magnesium-protoporphyrin IX monomethyl ester cyclase
MPVKKEFLHRKHPKLKILLIYPYFLEKRVHEEEIGVVPIGLYYIGAVLKENGYDVEIFNWHRIHENPQDMEAVLREKRPDIIGLSVFHANRWGAVEIAAVAKQVAPRVKIVFGGVGATFLWKHLLTRFPQIDFIVLGEGEYSFLDLVRCIENGDYSRAGDIHGIAFRKGKEVVKTAEREFIKDLDALPIPSRYFSYQHISSTRGCPGGCTFCGSPLFWKRKVRFHSPDYFVMQMELLFRKGVSFFYVSDDTFTIKRDRVIEICRKVLERGLQVSWAAISRVDHVDEEVLYWMRRAGCVQISYGIESGSDRIRRLLNKKVDRDRIREAFSLTTQYGILARAYFIYGCPGESPATIEETVRLMDEIRPLSVIFYILDLFPGTALYEDTKKRLGLTDDIWLRRIEDILYFETDPRLPQEKVLDFGHRLRTAYYGNLNRYVEAVELVDKKELYGFHADFLSRLGLTFSEGDYSRIDAVKEPQRVAEKLFEKALSYAPDHRAYLGLGMIRQRRREFAASARILSEGIKHYPESEDLNLCLGITLMNMGEYGRALNHLLTLQHSREGLYYLSNCYREIGDREKAAEFERRYNECLPCA